MFILLNANKMDYLQCLEKRKCRPIEAVEAKNMKSIHVSVTIIKLHFFLAFFFFSSFFKQSNQRASASQRDHIDGVISSFHGVRWAGENETKRNKQKNKNTLSLSLTSKMYKVDLDMYDI